jgi:beta-lactam-binding protein with PASTA domain
MPDLSGKTAQDAEKALQQAGFTKPPTFATATGSAPFPGDTDVSFHVSGQNPAAGTPNVPVDTQIVLTMTNGKGGGNG